MGTLLCVCVKVREVIELPIGLVSGWPRIGILDGDHIPKGKERFLGLFVDWFEWRF